MLTTKQIDHAKPSKKLYRLFDSLGLYVEIDPNGSKYWRLKYQFMGKEERLAPGKYPETSLLEARDKREKVRKLLAAARARSCCSALAWSWSWWR